jgi:hypothetical protein
MIVVVAYQHGTGPGPDGLRAAGEQRGRPVHAEHPGHLLVTARQLDEVLPVRQELRHMLAELPATRVEVV